MSNIVLTIGLVYSLAISAWAGEVKESIDSPLPEVVSSTTFFVQHADCSSEKRGCQRISRNSWRTEAPRSLCEASCNSSCKKPPGFDNKECIASCVNMRPIASLLKKHSPSTPKCIVIHHGGTFDDGKKDINHRLQALFRDSMSLDPKRGDKLQLSHGGKCQWGDVPYHFIIDSYGNVAEGRSPDFRPDTNTVSELNTDGKINIMVEGDYRTVDAKGQSITGNQLVEKQRQSITQVVEYLKEKYKTNNVTAHKNLASTECPGNVIMAKLAGILTGCPDDKNPQ